MLHAHHVLPVRAGGQHKIENMIMLCPNCHGIAHNFWPIYHGKYMGPKIKSDFILKMKKIIEGSDEFELTDEELFFDGEVDHAET